MSNCPHKLGLATLPGAVHTLVHNGCSFELWRMMREAGVYCEVEPRHLFNTLLPAAYLLQPGPRPNIVRSPTLKQGGASGNTRSRPGSVPPRCAQPSGQGPCTVCRPVFCPG